MGTVGVVGTGTMGSAMVRRLLLGGHRVVVHDAKRGATDALVADGAIDAGSVAELAADCRVVITSLPGPAEVDAVAHELATSTQPGDVHVGHSTVSVESARAAPRPLPNAPGPSSSTPPCPGDREEWRPARSRSCRADPRMH